MVREAVKLEKGDSGGELDPVEETRIMRPDRLQLL